MNKERSEKFTVGDERDPGWFWITNRTLELISKHIGITGIAVYSWLCAYRNNNTKLAFPSITTLADHCKISRRTVIRIIRLLEIKKFISIEHSQGAPNVYKLLDIKNDKQNKTTSIPNVTSEARDTGLVTPGIRGVVTPGIHEPDVIQPDEYNQNIKECFSYFLIKTKKSLKLTPERKHIIKQRLAEGFTIKQLKTAIDNFCRDDWPERYKYVDLLYCLGRQRGKPDSLERWLNFVPNSIANASGPGPGDVSKKTIIADSILEEKFGRIATKDMVKKFLREIPEPLWWKVDQFLRRRYPGSTINTFAEAEREVTAEARANRESFTKLAQGIGK